jgi:hypothetical protein
VPWYEKELYNLIREGRGVSAVPLVVAGIIPQHTEPALFNQRPACAARH